MGLNSFLNSIFGNNENKTTSNDSSATVSDLSETVAEESINALKSENLNLRKEISDLESRLKQKEELLVSAMSSNDNQISSSLQMEISTLKQKIEKLAQDLKTAEEDRDDFEYDAKKAKDKLKKESDENSKLANELSEQKRKMEDLQREYNAQTDELEDEKVLNKERKESIEFVNSILNAKEASDEYTKTRNEAIDNVRNTLWNYYDSLVYWDLDEGREDIISLASQWANERKKPWIKGKKIIALIGEFSAGKTSIVNRILSHDDSNAPTLPTNSKATTAIPTYISYGPEFISQFLDANGKLKNIKKEDFERVKKEILDKVNVSSLLDYFVLSYNNDYLKGLTILDTPGFSSNDPEDERRTCDVINEADILFWVFDVNQAINKTSIKIIKTNIKDVPLFIIMNKCDQLSPNEQNEKEQHLKKNLEKEGITVKGIIRFSETHPLDELSKAIDSIENEKEDDIISLILEDMYALYDSINMKYKEFQESVKITRRNLEITEENIQFYLNQYKEDSAEVGKMPQHESHFFSRDCFEISEDDYEEFYGRCQRMLSNKEPFEAEIKDLKELSKLVTEDERIFADLKKQRKMLADYEKKIIKVLKKYDAKIDIPTHVNSSSSDENKKTVDNSKSRSKPNSSKSDPLRPQRTNNGFTEDLRSFMDKNGESYLLKADILYLAKQYGISESTALNLAKKIANIH